MKPYYEQDGIIIYHGKCEEIIPELVDYNAIVTDPPYGLGKIMRRGNKPNSWKMWVGNAEGQEWDQEAPEIVATFPNLVEQCIIWGGNYFPLPPKRGWLIWDKMFRDFTIGHAELAWTTLDQPIRTFNYATAKMLAHGGKVHPTQKPLPLMQWCLEFLQKDSIVLDPFMGSGTTLRAAKDKNMKAIGIEQDEKYCEIAVQRLGQMNLFGSFND